MTDQTDIEAQRSEAGRALVRIRWDKASAEQRQDTVRRLNLARARKRKANGKAKAKRSGRAARKSKT